MALRMYARLRMSGYALQLQERHELVGAVLCPREHERLTGGLRLQDAGEYVLLPELVHRDDHVLDPLGGPGATPDLDRGVAIERRASERVHVPRDRRREEHRLTLVGEGAEDAAHVGREAHVEHPVGLVEHEDLELRIIDVPTL